MERKFSIITFGCRLNQYQSEKIRERLSACNLSFTENPEEAELVIVNGCVVTHRGERDTRKAINKYSKKGKKVIATGCYIKLPHVHPVNNVIFKEFHDFLRDYGTKNTPIFQQKRHRTLVGIQEGCDFRCSYCIVPFTRGKARDRHPEEIIEEIKEYVKSGTREIVLTGTDIGSFGKTSKIKLHNFIREIKEKFPGLLIRISSILPPHVNKEMVKLFRENILMPHVHLPLQSGSDKVLRSMRRPYKLKTYLKAFWELYQSHPDMAIGTDIIVGFPTETETDFKETLKIVEELPFAYAHVFLYSKRPLTDAFRMKELPYNIIKDRERKLIELINSKRKEFIRKFIGRSLTGIVEYNREVIKGTAANYIKFVSPALKNIKEGEIVKIMVKGEKDYKADAIILNTESQ